MATRERQKAKERKEKKAARAPHSQLRFMRTSNRKVGLLLALIRGKRVEEAMNILHFTQKRSAAPLVKLLQSAIANADEKGGWDIDRLYVKVAYADEGPILRRWMPRAQGRATRIRKRTSHVIIELAQVGRTGSVAPAAAAE